MSTMIDPKKIYPNVLAYTVPLSPGDFEVVLRFPKSSLPAQYRSNAVATCVHTILGEFNKPTDGETTVAVRGFWGWIPVRFFMLDAVWTEKESVRLRANGPHAHDVAARLQDCVETLLRARFDQDGFRIQ